MKTKKEKCIKGPNGNDACPHDYTCRDCDYFIELWIESKTPVSGDTLFEKQFNSIWYGRD
jgi:hypothetical protein